MTQQAVSRDTTLKIFRYDEIIEMALFCLVNAVMINSKLRATPKGVESTRRTGVYFP
jgi:hypothetical protein